MSENLGTPREAGVLTWYGEPIFNSVRWVEDGLSHLTIEELDLLAVAETDEAAAEKLGSMTVSLAYFLSEIPSDEITEHELQMRNHIFQLLGPVFMRHRRQRRRSKIIGRIRCAVSERLPGSVRPRRAASKWELQGPAPSVQSASVAASSA